MRSTRSGSDASTRSSSYHEESLPIYVKLPSNELIFLSIPASTSVATLLQVLSLRTSAPTSSLRLTLAGRHLTSDLISDPSLSSLNIQPNSTLNLSLPILGGMPPKKIRCSFKDCKDGAQRIIGDCSFCTGHYCGKHRMLEDHKCTGLEDCKKESKERNAEKLNSERTMVVKGI